MPAAVRGGSQTQAKPRAKAPPSPARQRGEPRKRAAAPSKKPPQSGGVSARLILAGAAVVLGGALTVTLATGGRAELVSQAINGGVGAAFGQAGFKLRAVHVEGASAMATADIVQAAGLYKDQPLIGLDLEGLRRKVQTVGWVKEARIVRLLPDTLVIAVDERRQLAVWQYNGKSVVIDDHGQVIPEANPGRFASLPLVVGAGGAQHAKKILPILVQRPRLMERMDALVRVDDRRWDLRLKDGSLIQLPAVGEEEALMRLEQLDQRSRILELGFERIDLRNPDVVAVRPRAHVPAGPPAAGGI